MRSWRAVAMGLIVGLLPLWSASAWAGPGATSNTVDAMVRRRAGDHVFLDGGEAVGLTLGQTLVVKREGSSIGKIEIVFLAKHSATARIVSEVVPITATDSLAALLALSATPLTALLTVTAAPVSSAAPALEPSAPGPTAPARSPSWLPGSQQRRPSTPRMRTSGTISVAWEGFKDGGFAARDVNDVTGRASLRFRDIGGKPYSVRVRTRMRQVSRTVVGSPTTPLTETRNRLYEVSLRYEPPDGRFSYVLGRVGVSPFVGLGYLDGGLLQVRLAPSVRVGAFGGAVPAVDGIRVDFAQNKYGAFMRFGDPRPSGKHRIAVVVAGVRAQFARGTRDYVSFETSYSSPQWSLFQRAEVDFSLPSSDRPERGTGLSTLSLSVTYRLAGRTRLYAGYHTRRDPLPGVTGIGGDPLDLLFRTSVRAGATVGFGRSGSVTFGGSVRSQQGTNERTYAGNLGASWRLGHVRAGATVHFYDGSRSKGVVATARLSGSLARDLHFVAYYNYFSNTRLLQPSFLGGSSVVPVALNSRRAGGDLTYDLSSGLYLRGGFEVGQGGAIDGTRAVAEAGFRF